MRRQSSAHGFAAAVVAKPLIVLAALIAAFVIAPSAASAAPTAHTAATAGWSTSAKPVTDTSNQFSNADVGDIGINAVFNCNYFSRYPYYVIDFTCNVTQGAIQLYVNCSDGRQILSGIMRAVGTYYARAVCGPPAHVVNFGAKPLV
jgi:hypothetical protein